MAALANEMAMEIDRPYETHQIPMKTVTSSSAKPDAVVESSSNALSRLTLANPGERGRSAIEVIQFGLASLREKEMPDAEPRTPEARDLHLREQENARIRRQAHTRALRPHPMADYAPRGDFYRGGGGYSRKRRYREDDDYDRRPQRRPYQEPLSVSVRKQILAVAESGFKRPEDEVEEIAKTIVSNLQDDYFVKTTLDLMSQLIIEQPLKIPSIAAITLHSNTSKPEFAQQLIISAGQRLQSHMNAGEWRPVKLILRFFACIQELFEGEGVFVVLEELFSRAVDLQTASSEDAMGLELVKIILLTIPYALASSTASLQHKAAELLERTDIIASTPHVLDALVDPYFNTDAATLPQSYSVLSLLQKQLQAEADKDWELAYLPRLYKTSPSADAADGATPEAKLDFPAIEVPQPLNPGPKAFFPEVFFSLYADQDIETVPPTSTLASSLLRDSLVDTINMLDFNRHAAAKFLVDLDCYWQRDTFVKRGTPFDKLKELDSKTTWKPEDLAVDAIFSQMLQLPAPEHKLAYFHSLIFETCKIAPAAIAPSLGRAIRFLYRSLNSIDVELSYRFLDWFSHHLSNFDFRWKWVEWVDDVECSRLQPRKAFILGVLDKEVRLSFAKRIRETLPDQYQKLIPPTKDNDIPNFKYNSDDTPFAAEGREILNLLKKKAPDSELQPVLQSIQTQAIEHQMPEPLLPSTDAYVTAICHIGSKSLSHVLSYIERCKERLLAIGPATPHGKKQIIQSVVSYWVEQNPGVAVNIVDKLLNYTILTPMSVIEWALVDESDAGKRLSETWMYEMIASTVFKVTNRVRQIVAARNAGGLPAMQMQELEDTLEKERKDMRALLGVIDDALVGFAQGSNDQMMERNATDEDGELELVKGWGAKWLRVFRRKLAVEEAMVTEMMKVVPKPLDEAMEMNGSAGVDIAAPEVANGDANGEEML